MFEDDIEDEELSATDADVDVEELPLDEVDNEFDADESADLGAAPDDVDDDEEGERPVRSSKAKAVTSEDELPTVVAKQKERDALAEAMAAFLSKGGKIQSLESADDE